MKILTCNNLNYKNIIRNLNVVFEENSTNFVSGPNKCGKTTLIRLLAGKIDSNDNVYFKKRDINKLSSYELSTLFSYVSISGNIEFNFSTIDQEMLFKLDKIDIEQKDKKKRYKELVKLFDLGNDLYNNIDQLTLEKKVSILLAESLITKPKILFLDDIFVYFNLEEATKIIKKLKTIENLTIIYCSTNLNIANEFDNMYIINRGELVLSGKTKDVLLEDSLLNKLGLELPFENDLSIKLKYYDLLNDVELNINRMVNKLWK